MDGDLNKDLDENLPWLTQKTEDLKSNKGNLTFSPHTVNVIGLNGKVIKKVTTPPPFLHQPPFSSLSPFLGKNFVAPPSDSIFGSSYPPTPHLIGVGGGGFQLWNTSGGCFCMLEMETRPHLVKSVKL